MLKKRPFGVQISPAHSSVPSVVSFFILLLHKSFDTTTQRLPLSRKLFKQWITVSLLVRKSKALLPAGPQGRFHEDH